MNIILNENEWAEEMIASHSLGDKPTQTLRRVAGYYYDNQYSKKEIRRLLENYLISCDPTISLVKWSDTLDRVIKTVGKRKNINVSGVDVTVPEMERINSLKGVQTRRLAFTILCIAKYWDAVSKDNNHWLNTPDNEVASMANIHTSIKRQSMLFGQLIESKMIRQSKKVDNLNVQVLFMRPGDVALHITDFRNLGYQYLKYLGEPYMECQNCGLVIKEKTDGRGPKQKYCPDCAVKIKTKQSINSVMRYRSFVPKS